MTGQTYCGWALAFAVLRACTVAIAAPANLDIFEAYSPHSRCPVGEFPAGQVHHLTSNEILHLIDIGIADIVVGDSRDTNILSTCSHIFKNDSNLLFATCTDCDFLSLKQQQLLLFKHFEPDRQCLLSPQQPQERGILSRNFNEDLADAQIALSRRTWHPNSNSQGDANMNHIVTKINQVFGLHRGVDGEPEPDWEYVTAHFPPEELYKTSSSQDVIQCDEVRVGTKDDFDTSSFLHDYVLRSRPVLLREAASHWPAVGKWSTKYFQSYFKSMSSIPRLMTKVVPRSAQDAGEFEGSVDAATWFEEHNGKLDEIPAQVVEQLESPDKVLVRPATEYLSLTELMDAASTYNSSRSYYVEYLSFETHLPGLKSDIGNLAAKELFDMLMEQGNGEVLLNVWIGHGNTTGKVHFDPYDNLMIVTRGSKTFRLYDPSHGAMLYEGHLREAVYELNSNGSFSRKSTETTSMVNSPVDINFPDLERYPEFQHAVEMQCNVNAGDVLFLPAWWWHEVESAPPLLNATLDLHTAVNYWFPPVFQKQFPCRKCNRTINMNDYPSMAQVSRSLRGL